MLKDRQNKILKILGHDDQTSVKELAARLKVSAVTVRQDLNFMESEGLLKRIHGGAVFKDADDIDNRLGINFEKKIRIARKLSAFVHDGETVLIESGSANALLARELVNRRNITIVTPNVYIARQFRKNEQARIILLGGIYQHESESVVGKITRICIDQINYDKSFIGIDGYTAETGFTLRDLFRAEISSYIIKKSKEVFIVSDSSKFGKTELTSICYPSEIQHIATDNSLDQQFIAEFHQAGIDLILA
jgi:DeoR/GlpR family transcriptional regulator of sugar metabolism